ncbi:MAG: alpha/beta hydrolase [Clostridium sp.]|nr:alpha/beta hydrolase [Clostridium sp.]
MALSGRANQNLMNVIRRVHNLVEAEDIDKHRHSQNSLGAVLGSRKDTLIREIDIDGMYGEWVSVDRAHMKKYVILYCHGGGYMTGSSLYARTLTTKLAASTSMDVFCFDYRLAPEHPYPAAAEDAMRAWNYLMLLGYGARDVIVAGDSAGGNLALSLTLKLKEEGRLLPRGLVLMSPWTDLTSSGRSHETRASLDPVLDKKYLDKAVAAYVGKIGKLAELDVKESASAERKHDSGMTQNMPSDVKESAPAERKSVPTEQETAPTERKSVPTEQETAPTERENALTEWENAPAERESAPDGSGQASVPQDDREVLKNPLISPLFGDFAGFPPTYIQVGDNEILLNDATQLHKNMIKANVSVKLDVFKGMWHVFQMSPFKTAYEAMDKNAEFIYDICR